MLSFATVLVVTCISILILHQDSDLEEAPKSDQAEVSTQFDLHSSFDFQVNDIESTRIEDAGKSDAFLDQVTRVVFDIEVFGQEDPVADVSSSLQSDFSLSGVEQIDYRQSELSRKPEKRSTELTYEQWLEPMPQLIDSPE